MARRFSLRARLHMANLPATATKFMSSQPTDGVPCAPQPTNVIALGWVDSGKSTLLGGLLHELGCWPKGYFDHTLAECYALGRGGSCFRFSFLMDSLWDERARGITLRTRCKTVVLNADDTKMRESDPHYFTFIDTPGYERRSVRAARSMVGFADLALVMFRAGHLPHSKMQHILEELEWRNVPFIVVVNIPASGSEDFVLQKCKELQHQIKEQVPSTQLVTQEQFVRRLDRRRRFNTSDNQCWCFCFIDALRSKNVGSPSGEYNRLLAAVEPGCVPAGLSLLQLIRASRVSPEPSRDSEELQVQILSTSDGVTAFVSSGCLRPGDILCGYVPKGSVQGRYSRQFEVVKDLTGLEHLPEAATNLFQGSDEDPADRLPIQDQHKHPGLIPKLPFVRRGTFRFTKNWEAVRGPQYESYMHPDAVALFVKRIELDGWTEANKPDSGAAGLSQAGAGCIVRLVLDYDCRMVVAQPEGTLLTTEAERQTRRLSRPWRLVNKGMALSRLNMGDAVDITASRILAAAPPLLHGFRCFEAVVFRGLGSRCRPGSVGELIIRGCRVPAMIVHILGSRPWKRPRQLEPSDGPPAPECAHFSFKAVATVTLMPLLPVFVANAFHEWFSFDCGWGLCYGRLSSHSAEEYSKALAANLPFVASVIHVLIVQYLWYGVAHRRTR